MFKHAIIYVIVYCSVFVTYNVAAAQSSVVRIVQLPGEERLLSVMREHCASELPCVEKNKALAKELALKRVTQHEVLQTLCNCYSVDVTQSSAKAFGQVATVIVSSGKTVAVTAVQDYILEWND